MDSQAETLEGNQDIDHQSLDYDIDAADDFETLARTWLSTLPADKSLNPSEVETWLQSNNSSLPDHIKSMPLSDVCQMFTSFLNDGNLSNEVVSSSSTLFIHYPVMNSMCKHTSGIIPKSGMFLLVLNSIM